MIELRDHPNLIKRRQDDGRSSKDFLDHHYDPDIYFKQAKEMGLPVSDQVPEEVYQLMELYPQARQQRPGVEYIPMPFRSPAPPSKGGK